MTSWGARRLSKDGSSSGTTRLKLSPEEANDQDGRLTNKHIKTLMVLEETIKENRELRRLLELLHSEKCGCNKPSDQRVEEAVRPLRAEIDKLNAELSMKNEQHDTTQKQLEDMQHALEEQRTQTDKLEAEKNRVSMAFEALSVEHARCAQHLAAEKDSVMQQHDAEKRNLSDQLDELKAESEKLRSSKQRIEEELEAQIDGLREEIAALKTHIHKAAQTEAQNQTKHSESAEKMRIQLAKHNESIARLRETEAALHQRNASLESQLDAVNATLLDTRRAFDAVLSEREKEKEARSASGSLRLPPITQSNTNDRSFREFVLLRRQFQELTEENERLRNRLKGHERNSGFLKTNI